VTDRGFITLLMASALRWPSRWRWKRCKPSNVPMVAV